MASISGLARNVVAAIFVGLLLHAARVEASSGATSRIVRAYGPGGPHHVIQECAELFREKHGVTVRVFKASPQELARRVREDGDIYFGGAEYMVEDFARENPGVLDPHSVQKLHARRVGLLVRKGNPLGIQGLDCLQRDEVHLLAARLENMAEFYAPSSELELDVWRQTHTGQDGVEAWLDSREIDAWITYESWHLELEDQSEFIELPCGHARRYTTAALTTRTRHRKAAEHFISFLKSPEARSIFVEHGWE
jgi:accessory colonization factor AcfC